MIQLLTAAILLAMALAMLEVRNELRAIREWLEAEEESTNPYLLTDAEAKRLELQKRQAA